MEKPPLHHRIKHHVHRIRHHITKFHRIRKLKEENLPPWKEKWNHFNETQLQELEDFIEVLIPWLVLILLFIILGEFANELNFFHWEWVERVAEFFHHYHEAIQNLDRVIIGFFIADLYFNFFKKRTVWVFLKTSILDIIAVAPFGLLFELAGLGEAQTVLHITTEAEKEAVKFVKVEKSVSFFGRIGKTFASIPRFLRLNRLAEFFKKK